MPLCYLPLEASTSSSALSAVTCVGIPGHPCGNPRSPHHWSIAYLVTKCCDGVAHLWRSSWPWAAGRQSSPGCMPCDQSEATGFAKPQLPPPWRQGIATLPQSASCLLPSGCSSSWLQASQSQGSLTRSERGPQFVSVRPSRAGYMRWIRSPAAQSRPAPLLGPHHYGRAARFRLAVLQAMTASAGFAFCSS